MIWIPIKEQLPSPFKLVALVNSTRFMNMPPAIDDPYPVCRVGFLNDACEPPYWSCYGERGEDLMAYTHWARLPQLESFKCFEEREEE